MKKIEKTRTITSLLSRALTLTSGINELDSVRYHLRLALTSLKKSDSKSKPRINDEWWKNVEAGTSKLAEGNLSAESSEATMKKALFTLDSMIKEENDKLKELENIVEPEKTVEIETGYEILNG